MQIALCAGATLAIVLLSLFHIYEHVMELVIHYVQNSLTGSMLPVINSMLSETAGLGFIGVVVQILALKGEDTWLGALSEQLYEKPEALLEQFEFIHNTFYWVAITYFITNAFIVLHLIRTVNEWERAYRLEPLLAMLVGDAIVKNPRRSVSNRLSSGAPDGSQASVPTPNQRTSMRVAAETKRETMRETLNLMPEKLRTAPKIATQAVKGSKYLTSPSSLQREYLRARVRFLEHISRSGLPVPPNFRFRNYLQEAAAEKLQELCNLDPIMLSIFWVPIGAVSIAANLLFTADHESVIAVGGSRRRRA